MALSTTFLCPYCYEVSKFSEVVYYCKKCNTFSPLEQKGLKAVNLFSAPLATIHSQCGTSATAVCPKCRHKLPEGTLTGSNSIISVVGTRGSGKSHFVGVLINELYRRVASDFGASFVGFDESHQLWERDFGRLYSAMQALDQTVRDVRLEPLIYELVMRGTLGNKMYTFAFFDTAGENLENPEQMAILNKYISQSSGIVFLFDPMQIPGIAARIDPAIAAGSSFGGSTTANTQILTHVAGLIRSYKGMKRTQRIKAPVAIVFTKLDAIASLVPRDFTVLRGSPHKGEVYLDDLYNVDAEIEALLREWGETAFVNQVEVEFEDYNDFALSALGFNNSPDALHDRRIKAPQPHRIEDPFLWILTELKVLKGTK